MSPRIVQDSFTDDEQLYYRDFHMLAKHMEKPELNKLKFSACKQPNVAGFIKVCEAIQSSHGAPLKYIIILDLRQETHGFCNRQNITHFIENDWINRYKNRVTIIQEEKDWLAAIKAAGAISELYNYREVKLGRDTYARHPAEEVLSEEELISVLSEKVGINLQYKRLTVMDHGCPDDESVAEFVALVEHAVLSDAWIAAHCRGGKGRSTTFMVMYDILMHAGVDPLEMIVERHAKLPPHYDVMQERLQKQDMTQHYQERTAFFQQFYDYALDWQQDRSMRWPDWIDRQANQMTTRLC